MLQQIIEGVYLLVTWPIVFNKSFLKKKRKKKKSPFIQINGSINNSSAEREGRAQ